MGEEALADERRSKGESAGLYARSPAFHLLSSKPAKDLAWSPQALD